MDWKQIFRGMGISGSGMSAERARMEVIARNIANARATRGPDGVNPYRRQEVVFRSLLDSLGSGKVGGGVEVAGITEDPTPFDSLYLPQHPDAGPDGYVKMPNVNMAFELTDMLTAVRAYEANAAAAKAMKEMVERTITLGR